MAELTLGKYEPLTLFEVWQPRYHDKTVLLKAEKVKNAKTQYLKIKFTKAPTMEGDWVISKQKAKSFPKSTNGTIQCYVIPLSELKILNINERDIRGV